MDFLPKLFIKNYKEYNDPKVRTAYGKMCGIFGIVSNFVLCTIKIIIGLLIGSIAIVADGINNLADAGSSIITLIGFKLASLPSDKDHPFGHQRIEYITGLIISIIVLIVGILLGKSSIEKLINYEVVEIELNIAVISVSTLVLAIIIKCIQSIFNRKYGRLINSSALIATSVDSLNDCISTSAVLISLVVSIFWPNGYLDGIMGILVSLFIIISGIKLIKETISPLIGEAPSKDFTESIVSKVMSYEGVLGTHDLVIHSYGPEKIFVTIHAEVDSKSDINAIHDVIDNIEKDFLVNDHINLVIHMDPIDIYDEEVLELKDQVSKIIKEIDSNLMFHDFRVVKGITHTNVLFDLVIPVEYCKKNKTSNEQIKNHIDEKLQKYNNKLLTVITFDLDYTGEE